MSVNNAFKLMILKQGRLMDIYALPKPVTPGKVHAGISNYHRDPEGPSSVTGTGREFVIIKEEVMAALTRAPMKGDRMDDPELGKMVIKSVKELPGLGGEIIGYRLRME